jgi:XRE family transcriptional regulator, aerobic/anaerobic benzoate catabolism transcriptional regulator
VTAHPLVPGARDKHPFLVTLGETVRTLRARRGMTRRALAAEADVSERHLANLESGVGNASILVLRQVADALGCPLTELFDAGSGASPDATLIRDLLRNRSGDDLQRARVALSRLFTDGARTGARLTRIALVGLRGAGKSTLGRMLAKDFGWPFVELTHEIERLAGCNVAEIHSLYGTSAYRRYERRALDDVVQRFGEVVIATPGGLVSDAATFNRLLDRCFTVWLQTTPEEHMSRVLAQGDYRPMAGNTEAMEDLRRILAGRAPFYAKADVAFDTSGRPPEESFARLRRALVRARAADTAAAD